MTIDEADLPVLAPLRAPHVDGGAIERVLAAANRGGARELLAAATAEIGSLLGQRASCILVEDRPRVVLTTEAPDLIELPLDLARYPEISAALAEGAVIAIEDVARAEILLSVKELLPRHLGAVAVVPLVLPDRKLGAILAQSPEPRTMSASARATARLIGQITAALLDARYGRRMSDALLPSAAGRPALPPPRRVGPRATPIWGVPLAETTRTRLLVAEDDRSQGEALEELLTEEGFDVTVVHDGAAAVRAARDLRPDLILLDVCMPVMDGFSAAEDLVKDPVTCHTPILFLSASHDLLPRVRGLRLEAMDFMRKPYTAMELLARVDRSLRQADVRDKLRVKINIDELTGLGNLRFLRERLAVEQSRIDRYGTTVAVAMIDVDRLKEINDRHGHGAGSKVLKVIGEAIRCEIRDTDLAARYGGDEFVVVLPHTTSSDAAVFCERVLARVRNLRPDGIDISVSIGVAALKSGERRSVESVVGEADAAAYRAKRCGRDRVCAFDGAVDSPPPVLESLRVEASGPRH